MVLANQAGGAGVVIPSKHSIATKADWSQAEHEGMIDREKSAGISSDLTQVDGLVKAPQMILMMAAESTALPYTNKPAPDVSAPAAILRSYDLKLVLCDS